MPPTTQRFSPPVARLIYLFLFSILAGALHAQTDTLRLIFAGDIMGHTPQISSAEVAPGKYDYRSCFRYVKPLLDAADLAIGNLELTLPGKGPYSGYPMFKSPDALAEALQYAGFDILLTANNHSNDSRAPGLVHTIETLRALGFQQTGTFKTQRERDLFYPLMVYRNGFKLALLNYTYGTNGVPTQPPTIVNLIDTVQIARDLAEARARKPHFIIVTMHWGLEYQLQENAEQRELARFLIRNGADLVVGGHPHVVQPIKVETVTMPDGTEKSAVVVYSLGNFISNQRKEHTDGGILFQVELLHRKFVPYAEVGSFGYIPVWRYIHRDAQGKTTFYTLPIARYERNPQAAPDPPLSALSTMKKFAAGVRKRLEKCAELD
ncbi:MAG: CapA family protein [Lewinellaceae bacterium]|nr:CapA family protein [Lewinellaceae bacterium]